MTKKQLIRVSLVMLLASASLMLSSCKKDPKDKAPEEALVGTRWQATIDVPGMPIPDGIGDLDDLKDTSIQLSFISQTKGMIEVARPGAKISQEFTYSYDAKAKAYRLVISVEHFDEELTAKVSWDTNLMVVYEGDSKIPMMYFKLIK